MYLPACAVLFLLLVLFILMQCKRRAVIGRICSMSMNEKCGRLNALTQPLGFRYHLRQDALFSLPGWGGGRGYCRRDEQSGFFVRSVDSEPVFFPYQGKTFLILMRKGQYGIGTGAEIGIFQADGELSPSALGRTFFQEAPVEALPSFSLALSREGRLVFEAEGEGGRFFGFAAGSYARPEALSLRLHLRFPEKSMLDAFVRSLVRMGYALCELRIRELDLEFTLDKPKTVPPRPRPTVGSVLVRGKNFFLCKLFSLTLTPFDCSVDQLLSLHGLLPCAFFRLFSHRCSQSGRRRPARKAGSS